MGYIWKKDTTRLGVYRDDVDYTCEDTGFIVGYVHPIYPINGPTQFECYVRDNGILSGFVRRHSVYSEREAMLHVEALVALEGL